MYIVFTDLDGTLLDHDTYSYEKSREGLHILHEHDIPLVLVSSKTFPEMMFLHKELGLSAPFIFENGGGISHLKNNDKYEYQILGLKVEELRKRFHVFQELIKLHCKIILDMEPEEIMALTGLSLEQANLAKARTSSIPFLIETDKEYDIYDLKKINAFLRKNDIMITKGGRFYHLTSLGTTKGNAITRILDDYRIAGIDTVESIGIGDSENDISMLEVVDNPFLVRKTNNKAIKSDLINITVTKGIGPVGFSEVISSLIL